MFSDVTKIKSLSVGLIHLLSELKFIYKVNEGLFFFIHVTHFLQNSGKQRLCCSPHTDVCHK